MRVYIGVVCNVDIVESGWENFSVKKMLSSTFHQIYNTIDIYTHTNYPSVQTD